MELLEEVSKTTFEYLLTQGILGLTTTLALLGCIYLERKRNMAEDRHRAELEAQTDRHSKELAEKQKALDTVMDTRIVELKASLEVTSRANQLQLEMLSRSARNVA